MAVKRIGLLGGMSWQSTSLYYQLLNEGVAERLGDLHSADCVLISVDFDSIARLQAEDRWEEAGALLADKARALQAAGADLVLLCTNTMHKVAPQIQDAIDIPLLHIVDVTADAARRADITRLGLLGTRFTMEQPFYRERMEAHGVELLVPAASDRTLVHRVIYEELCRGVVTEESREQVRAVIRDLVDRGAQGIILGCTEIELLIEQAHSPVPVLPTTALHARAAIDAALDGRSSAAGAAGASTASSAAGSAIAGPPAAEPAAAGHLAPAEFDRWYGGWDPLDPTTIAEFMAGFDRPWWIIGGWSIEAFTGVARDHEDMDISILSSDAEAFRLFLGDRWTPWNADEGWFRPFDARFADVRPDSQVWVRRDARSPWVLDVPFTPDTDGRWTNKRNPAHTEDLEAVTWVAPDGLRYARPEVTLMFKAAQAREKDRRDAAVALPMLGDDARGWLRDAVARIDAEHPWAREQW